MAPNSRFWPHLFIAFTVVSLLLFYSAYDKKTKQLDFGRLAAIFSFSDATYSLHEINKVAALAAIGLIAAAFILGPLARLWPSAFFKFLFMRKPIGLAGASFAIAHGAYSLVEFYHLDINRMVFQNEKAIGFLAAVGATIIFIAMSLTSTKEAVQKMGYGKWKALQTFGYAGLILAIIHFFVLETKPDVGFDVRPYGVAFFIFALLAVFMRAVVAFVANKPKEAFEQHTGEMHHCAIHPDNNPDCAFCAQGQKKAAKAKK